MCAVYRGRGADGAREGVEAARVEETPDWKLCDDGKKISRKFRFGNFAAAMQFAGRVGELAEQEDHHPTSPGWATAP